MPLRVVGRILFDVYYMYHRFQSFKISIQIHTFVPYRIMYGADDFISHILYKQTIIFIVHYLRYKKKRQKNEVKKWSKERNHKTHTLQNKDMWPRK